MVKIFVNQLFVMNTGTDEDSNELRGQGRKTGRAMGYKRLRGLALLRCVAGHGLVAVSANQSEWRRIKWLFAVVFFGLVHSLD
jgi:hypothetical protein